jgi:hypothetical protein
LHDSTNVSYNDLFSGLFYDKKKDEIKCFLSNVFVIYEQYWFTYEGKAYKYKLQNQFCDAAAANSPLSSSTRRKNFQILRLRNSILY